MAALYPRLIAAALGLLAAFTAGWTAQGWRMQSILDRKDLAYAQQLEAMHAQELADYQKMESTKNDAIKQAEIRAAENALAAATARATADRLRGDIARVPARISAASRAAVDEYAATTGELFTECAAEVAELARAADGHAADARLMRDAWPK